MRCMTAICPAGPPKLSAATRAQVQTASRNGTGELSMDMHRSTDAQAIGCFEPSSYICVHLFGRLQQHLVVKTIGRHLLDFADALALDRSVRTDVEQHGAFARMDA